MFRTRLLQIVPAFLLIIGCHVPASASTIKSASYWIKRLDAPDALVLTAAEIDGFNRIVLGKTDQMADMENLPSAVSREQLTAWLLFDPVPEDIARFGSNGKRIKNEFFSALRSNMNLDGVMGSNEVRFGVVVKRADIRAFPTDEQLLKRPGALEFDTVQYSSIYPPERAALLHTSKDGLWGFFQTGMVRGWIRLDNIAFEDKEAVFAGEPLVVTGSHVNVYGDKGLRKVLAAVPMGDALPLVKEKDGKSPWVVRFPQKNGHGVTWVDGYIDRRSDVRVGYLPYTKRNVLTQAFKMLGEKYGWGGKDGRRDCSEFVKDIFASMGIRLPRNSHEQASVGVTLTGLDPGKDVSNAFKNAEPAITLVGLERHIMLFIGSRGGNPYVIHQFVGYRSGKRFMMVNRVDVTTLNLGARSREGSFKSRIKSVTEVLVPPGEKTPIQNHSASIL